MTALDPDRLPVVIASGQVVERDETVGPLDLAERASRIALDAVPGIAARVNYVAVVGVLAPLAAGPAPASKLVERLGLDAPVRETTTVGGNTPQMLVTRIAGLIAFGEPVTALIAGGEAMHSARRPRDHGSPSGDEPSPDPVVGDNRFGSSPEEMAAGLLVPAHIYPLLESVLAARTRRSFAEHRIWLGNLMAPFTKVAAGHPCAWFPEVRSGAELTEAAPDNRIVAEPYTKRLNAFLNVDQGAALVVTSLAEAERLGVADRAVFVWSGAGANDVWFPAARPDLGASPAIAAAGRAVFDASGVGVDEIDAFDLYSCFPVAVELAAIALGLQRDDPRGFTVTGGLPYFGGPGNNYSTHAIATMTDRLRESGGLGLVTALGWYATKHAVGLYGAAPPRNGFVAPRMSQVQGRIDATGLHIVGSASGPATVEAATVIYDREGVVSAAPIVATLPDGRRLPASAGGDLAALAGVNLVGRTVQVNGHRYRVRDST